MKIIILRNFRVIPTLCSAFAVVAILLGALVIYPISAQTKNLADKDLLKDKIIAIDPGHGGADPGAVGISGSLEKDINLALAKDLQKYLKKGGAQVVMTRTDDDALGDEKREDLDARAAIVKEGKADIFVSMQCNATTDPNCLGAQVFYYPQSEKGESLAKEIQSCLWQETEQTKKREAQTISSPYILYTVDIPAVIVEAGFLSNAGEEAMLLDEVYQKKVAKSVYDGIINYYKAKPTFLGLW